MAQVWMIIISILQALWLPLAVYVVAGMLMILASGHRYVQQQWKESRTLTNRTSLNMRWRGYNAADVAQLWGALDRRGLISERRFLKMDLIFPLFYGGSFLIALLGVWADLGKPFSSIWLVVPVVVTVLADWTENLTQLGQLRRFTAKGKEALQDGSIHAASIATVVKLFSFILGLLAFLLILACWRGTQMAK